MTAKALSESPEVAFELAFRIRHPSIDPAELTRVLGLEPTHTFRAGEARQARTAGSPAQVHAESYWLATLDPMAWLADIWPSGTESMQTAIKQQLRIGAWNNLGAALAVTARVLVRSHKALFLRISAEGGQVSLLVSLSPMAVDNFSIAPEVSQMFGELGITVEFELTAE